MKALLHEEPAFITGRCGHCDGLREVLNPQWVRAWRLALGWSQSKLAKKSGVHDTMVSQIESNNKSFGAQSYSAKRIVAVLAKAIAVRQASKVIAIDSRTNAA